MCSSDLAAQIHLLARARRSDSAWPDIARQLRNALREQQRQALVAHLIARQGLTNSDDLYGLYLIDVAMSPATMTSRLKQAAASVQLFVQRCLLNLEPEITPDTIDTDLWSWMKNYRVWEANRKVFLFPENWIEPELRDDQSEFFRQLNSDLLHSEPTHETGLTALMIFVEKLSSISRVTVVAMFHEVRPDTSRVTHLLGKSRSSPARYFYREWTIPATSSSGYWATWEEVNLGLNTDHILLFEDSGIVNIAWPTLKLPDAGGVIKFSMNIAQRMQFGWANTKRSREEWSIPAIPNVELARLLRLQYSQTRTSIPTSSIDVFAAAFSSHQTSRDFSIFDTKSTGLLDPIVNISTGIIARYVDKNGVTFSWSMREHVDIVVRVFVSYRASGDVSIVDDKYGSCNMPARGMSGALKSYLTPESGDNLNGVCKSIEFSINVDGLPSYAKTKQTKVFDVSRLSQFSIVGDFIVELIDHNYWLVNSARDLTISYAYIGSFQINPEGNLGIEQNSGTPISHALKPDNVESYESNFREGTESSLSVSQEQLIGASSGRFYAASCSDVPILTYSDDKVDCVIWRHLMSPTGQYCLSPASSPWSHLIRQSILKTGLAQMPGLPFEITPIDFGAEPSIFNKSKSHLKIGIDFDQELPWSVYNWEMFFHVPLLVATQLMQNQRFEEAQRWLHLVFDPTAGEIGSDARRFWRFKPFQEEAAELPVEQELLALATGAGSLHDQVATLIAAWKKHPFQPHLLARTRHRAYQIFVVLRYLDNMIAWGDQLFRQDTIESINEATLLYTLASEILGRRPARINVGQSTEAKSYSQLGALDEFSNAMEGIETLLPAAVGGGGSELGSTAALPAISSLYFGVPANDKLIGYWDTVEDRLFKIRHSQNIEGVSRQLPLQDPPIDPALLVRAVAAGVDISSALANIQSPLPHYRFNVIAQKALELCSEVRAFGGSLLASMEKQDAEGLALLRSTQELSLLRLIEEVRTQQADEARPDSPALRPPAGCEPPQ